MFILAEDLGNALNALLKDPCFPESSETDDNTKGLNKESESDIKNIFAELLSICGSIAQESPAATETIDRIKGLFKEINSLKDLVEQLKAARDESINEEPPMQPDGVNEKPTEQFTETKPEIIESRVTGEGPVTPMM